MSTSNLFVELLVIGIGAGTWVGLLAASILGTSTINIELLRTYPALIVGLAIVYVLGVISDRIADFVFDKLFSAPIRKKHFRHKRDYQDARRMVFQASDRLADQHEYGRIRIRVVRGWAINSLLIAVAYQIFMHSQFSNESWFIGATLWGTLGLIMLSIGCWWSWTLLCSTEYLKIKEHAEFLRCDNSFPQVRSDKAA